MIHSPDVASSAAAVTPPPPPTTPRQHHGIVISVHRSMSLQQPFSRRPTVTDRNNNAGNVVNSATSNVSLLSCGAADGHRSSDRQFELANVLQRAATIDAKFQRQLNDYVQSASHYDVKSASSNDVTSFDSGGVRLPSRFVQLPERYQTVRRSSLSYRRNSATSTCSSVSLGLLDCSSPGTGGYGIGTALNTVPEGRPNTDGSAFDENTQSECKLLARRYDEAMNALKWLRQEIGELKQQDRVIMRTLLELGTSIHQLNGGLHETVSCHMVASPPLDMSMYNLSEYQPTSTPLHQSTSERTMPTSMEPYSRTVSMLEIPQNKSGSGATDSKQRTSPAARFLSRLGLRSSSTRSADQITE